MFCIWQNCWRCFKEFICCTAKHKFNWTVASWVSHLKTIPWTLLFTRQSIRSCCWTCLWLTWSWFYDPKIVFIIAVWAQILMVFLIIYPIETLLLWVTALFLQMMTIFSTRTSHFPLFLKYFLSSFTFVHWSLCSEILFATVFLTLWYTYYKWQCQSFKLSKLLMNFLSFLDISHNW